MYYVLLHWQTCVLNIEKKKYASVVRQNTLIQDTIYQNMS